MRGGFIISAESLREFISKNAPTYENCEIFLIYAHGGTDPYAKDPYPTVPENTYLTFTVPSGLKTSTWPRGIPYPTTIVGESHTNFISSLFEKKMNYDDVEKDQFEKGIFTGPTSPIAGNTLLELGNIEYAAWLTPTQRGSSIYEPRTPYVPTLLSFKHSIADMHSVGIHGIYKLPLSKEFVGWFTENKRSFTRPTNVNIHLESRPENIGSKYLAMDTVELETILDDKEVFPPLEKDHYRIIILEFCRDYIGNAPTAENRSAEQKNAIRKLRRASINLRRRGVL